MMRASDLPDLHVFMTPTEFRQLWGQPDPGQVVRWFSRVRRFFYESRATNTHPDSPDFQWEVDRRGVLSTPGPWRRYGHRGREFPRMMTAACDTLEESKERYVSGITKREAAAILEKPNDYHANTLVAAEEILGLGHSSSMSHAADALL